MFVFEILICKNILSYLLTTVCFPKVLCGTEVRYAETKGFAIDDTEKLPYYF